MKTKTKFDSTSDARNLINSVVEKFPKGPERDGLQTKLREFYNCFVGAMRLPQGYDRSKVIEEGTQNLHAAQRIADRVDKQNGNAKFSTMISILASNLTDLKRDHSKAGKVEDNFYGKRVVKGIFAKAKFDKSNYYALEGTVDGNATGSKTVETIEEAMYYGKAMLEHMKKQSPKAKVATVHIFKVVNYQRENKPVKVLNSRTGSKAKFAASKFEVGSTYEMRWDSQNFSHYKVLERTASTVKIEDIGNRVTNPDSSDASMRSKGVVIPQKGETVRVKIHTSGDGEFCFPTGRYSMSPTLKASKKVFARQGFKTKFANEEIAKGLSKVLKIHGFNAMASEVLSGSTDSETLRKYIRALKSKMSPMSGNDRGMVLLQTLEKQLASRTGSKAKFANGGTKTASFLAKIDSKSKSMILENIAKNYGISAQAAFAEVTDSEAENLLDYMTEPARSAASVLMQKHGSFARTGAKAKFSHLSTMLDMLDYQSANDQEDLARKNIKGLAQSIGKLNPTKDEWSRYVKIAKSLGFSESQISGFACTGVKVFK